MSQGPSGEIVLYQGEGGEPAIHVRLDGDTVWLSQQQLADLFQTSRTNVVEHVGNIYAEGELAESATCREFRQVRTEGRCQVSRHGEIGAAEDREEGRMTYRDRWTGVNTRNVERLVADVLAAEMDVLSRAISNLILAGSLAELRLQSVEGMTALVESP